MEGAVAVPWVICQVKVSACPAVIVLGEAIKLNTNGTVTVTLPFAVPPGPDAAMLNVVVEATGTIAEPDVGSGPMSSCGIVGEIATDVALLVGQVSVVVCPAFTAAGVAENCVICVGTGRTTCTTTV